MTDLTQLEVSALNDLFNLADAHTHQRQSVEQSKIIHRLPEIWQKSEDETQKVAEQRFIQSFMTFRGQKSAIVGNQNFLNYSASCSMTVAANLCKKRDWEVALIQPTFDNLADILKNFSVPCTPFGSPEIEQLKTSGTLSEVLLKSKVWMFVEPNNPTNEAHFIYNEDAFRKLLKIASENQKVLFFDFCFALFVNPFLQSSPFDAYRLLDEASVSYIAIEDTGKIWPLQDAKTSILRCSDDLHSEVYDIHSTYILNVSPFVLNVCSEYIRLSQKDNLNSVASVLEKNRTYASNLTDITQIELVSGNVPTSVMWFKLLAKNATTEMCKHLASMGVHLLPGRQFFWDQPFLGERYFRIALARDPLQFASALDAARREIKVFLS